MPMTPPTSTSTTMPLPPPTRRWQAPRDHRRVIALAVVASAVLHASAYLAVPHFIAAWYVPRETPFDAVIVPAFEPPPPPAPVARATPKPRRAAKPKPAPPPLPVEQTPTSAADFAPPENAMAVDRPATDDASSENAPSAAVIAEPTKTAEAAPAAAAPVSAPNAAAAPPVPAAPVEPLPPPPDWPARISIAYKMTSSISDGVADYTWKREGNKFEIESSMQATGFMVGRLLGTLHQVSVGEFSAEGLRPLSFRIRRGEGEADTADFVRASSEMRLARGRDSRVVPLPPGIQDTQSFLFQLAYDAPRLRNADDRLDVLVTNARKVYRHRFKLVGRETVQTRMGPLQTMHLLSEAADPEDVYEVWLAPAHFHLPVKIKFFAGRFPIELVAAGLRSTP